MGFFSDIGNAFSSAASSVGSGFKKIGTTIADVAKPVFNKAIKPVYNKVIKPVAERGIKYVEHGIDRVERIADAGTRGAEGVGSFLENIGNSPMLIAGVIALGAVVALRR